MTAIQVLQAARQAGVQIAAQKGDLVLQVKTPPPTTIIEALRCHKAEILALLTSKAARFSRDRTAWTAEDWWADFAERADFLAHNKGLPRDRAERQALEEAVQHWMCAHPPSPVAPEQGCVFCGERGERSGNILLPVLARDGHAWVHAECYEGWMDQLKGEALRALGAVGVAAQSQPETNK
jgi:hypothetical protein